MNIIPLAVLGGLLPFSMVTDVGSVVKIKRRGWKEPGTSATGSISTDERERRNRKRKQAKQARKRNR